MVTVRKATLDDVDDYVAMLKEFHNNSPMSKSSVYDKEHMYEFIAAGLQSEHMLFVSALEDDKLIGVTGAILYPLYFNPSHVVVQELWWWLNPDVRGNGAGSKMFKFLEDWAKDKQALKLFMIALEDERALKMEKVYKRAGFTPVERTFVKEL